MSFIDKIVEGLGLVDEEEYYEDELEKEEKRKAERKAEKKSFFGRKDKEATAEAGEAPAKKKGLGLNFSFGKKKEEAKVEAPAVEEAKPVVAEALKAEQEAPAKKGFMDSFKKKEKKEAPVKKEPLFKEKKRPDRTINLPIDNKQVNVVIMEPVDFNDSPKIADFLRNGQPVVVNFDGVDPVLIKRMTDFIAGTIYALNGSLKKLGRNILVCAPRNVDIDAGVEYEEKGEKPWKK